MILKLYALKAMSWLDRAVVFYEEFHPEFELLAAEVQDELLAHAKLLARSSGRRWSGPGWIRPKDRATPT